MTLDGHAIQKHVRHSKNYKQILMVLQDISKSTHESGETKFNAALLLKKMMKRETGYLCLLWNDILKRSNKTSILL